jgi:hypothetical protein
VLFPRQEASWKKSRRLPELSPSISNAPALFCGSSAPRHTELHTIADNFIDISFSMSYSLTNLTLSPQEA